MGWQFPIKYGNIAAYITAPESGSPPRVTSWELREFLGCLQGEYREKPPLISSDRRWIEEVVRTAKQTSGEVYRLGTPDQEYLGHQFLEHTLRPLKVLLGNYELFGLLVGRWKDNEELTAFAHFAAQSSR